MRPSAITSEFAAVCKLIEADANYRPDCTGKQLMNLVMEIESGNPRYTTKVQAVVIKPSAKDCNMGKLYNFLTTGYGDPWGDVGSPLRFWYADVIKLLVMYNGSVSFYKATDLTFDHPLTTLSLDQVLGNRCLFTAKGREGLTPNPALSR